MRKIFFNEEFFENIDCESKAYWLGFIAADGSVTYSKKNKCLEICLSEKDRNHLVKFKNDVEFTGEIRSKKPNAVRLVLYSKKIVQDLIELGLCPAKTFILTPWIGEEKLQKHYWRGYFDGDGCFTFSVKKRKNGRGYVAWNSNLLGTKEMVESFGIFVKNHNKNYKYNNGTVSLHGKDSKIWKINFGGLRPSQSVVRAIYSNAELYMDRKFQLAQEILSTDLCEQIIKDNFSDVNVLMDMYNSLKSWNMVADKIGVSRNGLYKHIRKLNLPRRKWGQLIDV